MSYREALRTAFAEYIEEMGDEYDAETFVDFVVASLHLEGDVDDLIDWYRNRADELELEAMAVSKLLSEKGPTETGD